MTTIGWNVDREPAGIGFDYPNDLQIGDQITLTHQSTGPIRVEIIARLNHRTDSGLLVYYAISVGKE